MKKTILFLATAMTVSPASAQGIMSSFNEKGYGVVSGRIQYLGMYRDYENVKNGNASTLGAVLGYLTPKWSGFDAGLAYITMPAPCPTEVIPASWPTRISTF